MPRHIVRSVFILGCILFGLAAVAIAQDAERIRRADPKPVQWIEIDEEVESMSTPNHWVSTDGRWDTATSWSLGHVPATTEIAIFSDLSQVDCGVPSTVASECDGIQVTERSYSNIGGPGSWQPLAPAAAASKVTMRGHGKCYLYVTQTTPIIMDSPDGELHLYGAYIWQLWIKRGKVYASPASFYTGARVMLYGVTSYLYIGPSGASGASFPAIMTLNSGRVLNDDELGGDTSSTRVFQTGGLWTQKGIINDATLIVISGGTFEYIPNADPAAQTDLTIYVNGILDVTKSNYVIPIDKLVIGPQGEVRGSAIEPVADWSLMDLRQDYP